MGRMGRVGPLLALAAADRGPLLVPAVPNAGVGPPGQYCVQDHAPHMIKTL
jgi:hypothetical protein